MRSRAKKNQYRVLIASMLLFALIALITGIVWNDKRKAQISNAPSPTVEHITINRSGFADILLTHNNEQWHIEQPCKLPANPQRLLPLLDALAPVTHGYDANEVDLDAAGLIKPAATIVFNDTQILVGQTDLSGERRYILRNERVEFVPEWILSLINGGLSALAMSDVFANPLRQLIFDTAGQEISLSGEQLEEWQSLQAQQIVTWPLPDDEQPLASFNFIASTKTTTQSVLLHHFPQFSAMHFENEQCAFILATDALPSTAPR